MPNIHDSYIVLDRKLWETFAKLPLLSPAIGGMSDSNFNPQNTQCIPVVKIFAFLELESRFSGKHFSKVSLVFGKIRNPG
jgi:hypothetical protein